jgi:hypothetical protein
MIFYWINLSSADPGGDIGKPIPEGIIFNIASIFKYLTIILIHNYLIFFKIRPSLTTSKEGLITKNIHLETTRILILDSD